MIKKSGSILTFLRIFYHVDAVYAPVIRGKICKYTVSTRKKDIDIKIPISLIQRSSLFGKVLEIMERSIVNKDTEKIFLSGLQNEPQFAGKECKRWIPSLLDVFQKVSELERNDHIWSS